MCMSPSQQTIKQKLADRPPQSGVHYGGGKHAILLKNPETFAKVCKC